MASVTFCRNITLPLSKMWSELMARELEIGIDVGIYGRLAEPEHVLSLGRLAEEQEYHSVWLADHVVFPSSIASKYPYSPNGDFPVPGTEPLLEPVATIRATSPVRPPGR